MVFRWGGPATMCSNARMNHRNFAVALFFFGLAGCTGLPATEAQSQPIINGTDDTGDPAVVVVAAQMPNSQQASLCTGSIISPHVILTAAHCVSPATVGAGAKF